ncbi:unnamed protein product [Caenorhabditis angaria]|uniref:Serine/threonine-protein phosphatase n=1 Tax=Caenorhabditis angaria TaxID=860376 RepID=A0A9P1N766_9PELO|nr:unnamed protein product [Caenorhabditis angaria]
MVIEKEKVIRFVDRILLKLMTRWQPAKSMTLFTANELAELCLRAREMMWNEPICLKIKAPITVVGDIHGQFEDLLAMLDSNGWPITDLEIKEMKDAQKKNQSKKSKSKSMKPQKPPRNYLFLGDYVDRGPYSMEVVILLIALKIKFPDRIYLLRGNHESRAVNSHYGFYRELKQRYSVELYEYFQNMFNCFPFTAIVNDTIMCMHGGISSLLEHFDQFSAFKRPLEIPDVGVLADLTWADPDPVVAEYEPSPRGASYVFGSKALRTFQSRLGLQLIIRGHQVVDDGYEFFDERRLVTIFSAPNYCGQQDNSAAMLNVSEDLVLGFFIFRPESRDLEKKNK